MFSTEVLKALARVGEYCLTVDNCKNCPFKNLCNKQPSEWLDYIEIKPDLSRLRTAAEIYGKNNLLEED